MFSQFLAFSYEKAWCLSCGLHGYFQCVGFFGRALALSRLDGAPRQEEFLRLAMQGKSNDEIARHAGVKVDTVKKTVAAAYARLGVKNRA